MEHFFSFPFLKTGFSFKIKITTLLYLTLYQTLYINVVIDIACIRIKREAFLLESNKK